MEVKKIYILLILLFSFQLFAKTVSYHLTDFETLGSKKTIFSFKDVCHKKNYKNLIFIEAKNDYLLDCMGMVVNIRDFCLNELEKMSDYIRGYINTDKKNVVCETAKRVSFSIQLSKANEKIDSVQKCYKFGNYLATNHRLIYHSIVPSSNDQAILLNCHFSSDEYFTSLLDQ